MGREDKYREVKRKHNVKFYEGVPAFDDPKGYEIPDLAGHEDRWMSVGATANGRIIDSGLFRGRLATLSSYHRI